MNLPSLLLGLVLSLLIAAVAFWRGSLSSGGVIGAVLVGTLVFAFGGFTWAVLLVAFFVTSSLLSHYEAQAKQPLAEKFQKGHRRDLGQVLANGGAGALIACAFAAAPHPLLLTAFVGAMATVNADTWSTELGVLSKTPPRLVTNGRRVAVGTSGAVTLLGSLVALAGALLIGGLAAASIVLESRFFSPFPFPHPLLLIPIGALSGFVGSFFDSFLGATVQAIYYCEADQKETESAVHRCGRATRLIRGWRWLDNDWVNFLSSLAGSLVAVGSYAAASRWF